MHPEVASGDIAEGEAGAERTTRTQNDDIGLKVPSSFVHYRRSLVVRPIWKGAEIIVVLPPLAELPLVPDRARLPLHNVAG